VKLSDEDKRLLREQVFANQSMTACLDCGGAHLRACPRIRRQVWVGQGSSAGTRTEVEYWPEWDDSMVAYPEDVWADSDEES